MDMRKLCIIETVIFDSSSTSSSDESDMEDANNVFDEADNDNNKTEKRHRVQFFIETVIYRYSDKEFQENFRMHRTTFDYLLLMLREHIEGNICGFGNVPISPEKQLYITLYVLGTPGSFRSVVTKFDVGKATGWRTVLRVVKAICHFRNYFIQWPTQEEVQSGFKRIEDKYGFPKVLGAIDGTHIQISSPKKDSQSYINRKNVHSIQLQVTCNDKLEFMHCYVELPGSVHDMRVFKYSGIQQRCTDEYFPQNSHLLGDSAYTIQKHVIVPYKDNGHLTVEQVHFNKVLSRTRMMVERSIGLLKCRWRCLLEKLPMKRTDLIPYYILCCCILHNVCLKQEGAFEYPVVIPDTIDANVEPLACNDISHNEGVAKRNLICHVLST